MANTKIEWCDKVWNPVTGCTPVSAGCDNCYARRMANRLQNNPKAGKKYCNGFKPTEHGNELFRPAQWHPSRIFVCSMGDLFHEDIHFKFIEHILDRIMFFSQHTFLILTKRPKRMKAFFEWLPENKRKPLENLWLGVSIENQQTADERTPVLLQIPAAKRFISAEPLLGPIDLIGLQISGKDAEMCPFIDSDLHWVIAGGESGPGARPMHPDWARSLKDQCQSSGVPFFFKGWGEWVPAHDLQCDSFPFENKKWFNFDPDTSVCKVGKKHSGHLLGGKVWREWPK